MLSCDDEIIADLLNNGTFGRFASIVNYNEKYSKINVIYYNKKQNGHANKKETESDSNFYISLGKKQNMKKEDETAAEENPPEQQKISSGIDHLDKLLDGGYEKDVLTAIYGPAGSGKTTHCLLAAIRMAGTGKKIVYMDTEGGVAVERIRQITTYHQKALPNILFLRPATFQEQKKMLERLKDFSNEKIGLIIVDTISMRYRLEMGKAAGKSGTDDVSSINKMMAQQFSFLSEIAGKKSIPVLITNQVYADFKGRGGGNGVHPVGGDIVKYGSRCLLELKKHHGNMREIILRKHRSLPEGKNAFFRIVEKGVEKVKG